MADRNSSVAGEDVGKLAAAVAAGYLLGRTRRMKWAIGIGTWYLTRRYGVRPGELALEAGQKLVGGDDFKGLRRQALRFGRRQARGLLSGGIESLTDALHQRTVALQNGGEDAGAGEQDDAPPRRRSNSSGSSGDGRGRAAAPKPRARRPAPGRRPSGGRPAPEQRSRRAPAARSGR